jgi:hypothetical protein
MRSAVIGQTGTTVLSNDMIHYKLSQKRTVRYQYQKLQHGWIAWICGPFHSRTYGACGFGATKARAKSALYRNLNNSYGYLGNMIFSDVDESDTIGIINMRLLDDNAGAGPITRGELCGSAGM